MHAVLGLVARHPQWLLEHAEAYAALGALECDGAYTAARRQALLFMTAVACAFGALLLAGVAMMLSTSPAAGVDRSHWVLVAVPLVPAVVAAGCWLALQLRPRAPAFVHLRRQLQVDLQLLRAAGTP